MKHVLRVWLLILACVPVMVSAAFDQNLKYGSKGQAVIELQNFLIKQGYLVSEPTGNYYTLTQNAVMAFQKAYNISPISGYFGPLTRAKAVAVAANTPNSVQAGDFAPATNLVVTAKSCSEIWLTWSLPNLPAGSSPVSKIEIFRNNNLVSTIDSTYGTFVDQNLGNNDSFVYAVRLVNAVGGKSTMSASVAASPQGCTKPTVNAPTNLSVKYNTNSSVILSWADNSSNEIGFEVERSVDGGAFTSAGKIASNLTTVTDNGIAPGFLFKYRIKALGSSSTYSPYSNEVTYKIGTISNPTSGRKLGVFDSNFTTPMFKSIGHPLYWTGLGPWSHSDGVYMSQSDVQKIAIIARDGGPAYWSNIPIPANSFLVIDVENVALEQMPPADMAQRMKWIKDVAPNLKLGLYSYIGPWKVGCNNDDAMANNAAWKACFQQLVDNYKPIVPYIDAYVYTAYLLGPGATVDRDLAYFKQLSIDWRKAYPNTPIVPFVWGAFHDTWNPPHSFVPDSDLRKYVKTMTESFDGVIVWGPEEDNAALIRIMKEQGALVLPAGAPNTWLASFAPNL